MVRDKALIWFFLLVLAMLLVPFVHAQDEPASHVRMVRVTSVNGQVQISHRGAGGYANVTINAPIVQGDVLRTGDDGWVEIQMESGSRIRLSPDSEMDFTLLSRFASGSIATEVNLNDGEAAFAVVAGDDLGPFSIDVHQRVISLKRSSRFRVTSVSSDPLEVVVWKGEVGIFDRDAGQEVDVRARETFMLDPQDAGHYDLEKEAQVDELDDWANQRDQALMASADTGTYVPPLQYSSPTGTAQYSAPTYYGEYYGPAALAYESGFGFGGPGGFCPLWAWGPWACGGGFPFIFVPTVIGVPRHHPTGIRPPVTPPAVRAAASSPAFTMTTDNRNRAVISNEHPVVENLRSNEENIVAPVAAGRVVVHPHPPVDMAVVRQEQVKPGVPQVHVAPPAARPSTFSPPRSTFSPATHPASAPAVHSGGAHR